MRRLATATGNGGALNLAAAVGFGAAGVGGAWQYTTRLSDGAGGVA